MSKSGKALPPIRKTITVHVPPKQAFDVFTKEMNRWWPAEYTAFPREAIVIEPKRDGRWFERGTEGSEGTNGKVLDWQVDDQRKYDPDLITELEVRFAPDLITELEVRFASDGNGGTHIALEHRDLDSLGDFAEPTHATMDGDEGWSALLERYADATKTS